MTSDETLIHDLLCNHVAVTSGRTDKESIYSRAIARISELEAALDEIQAARRRADDAVALQHIEIDRLRAKLAAADESARLLASVSDQRIAAWMETAAQYSRNADFYHGIVSEIGEVFGDDAKTSDDGTLQEDVLALTVPGLVKRQQARIAELEAALLCEYCNGTGRDWDQHGEFDCRHCKAADVRRSARAIGGGA